MSPHEDSESITKCGKSARTLILVAMWRLAVNRGHIKQCEIQTTPDECSIEKWNVALKGSCF